MHHTQDEKQEACTALRAPHAEKRLPSGAPLAVGSAERGSAETTSVLATCALTTPPPTHTHKEMQ